jgi:alkylhydroperoxidase family enzyme
LAALDSDWSSYSPAEQAAFALARRLTLEPHKIADADIDRCREHFTDLQILEMILSVCGNNSTNRWKEGIGVPQSQGGGGLGRRSDGAGGAAPVEEEHSYVTPTSEAFRDVVSLVAPVYSDETTGRPTERTVCLRPVLETPAVVAECLAAAAARTPRLPVVEEALARETLGEVAPAGPLPQWMRLLANFPIAGKRAVASFRATEEQGDLSPLLKAQISWVIARQDRAWYALGDARRRLLALGQSDSQIEALDGNQAELSPADRALLVVARHLAASPMVLAEAEVARAVELAGPRDVVQTVNYTTCRAAFDRFTEAAALPIEP